MSEIPQKHLNILKKYSYYFAGQLSNSLDTLTPDEVANELLSEFYIVYTECLKKYEKTRGQASFETYLTKALMNAGYKYFKKQANYFYNTTTKEKEFFEEHSCFTVAEITAEKKTEIESLLNYLGKLDKIYKFIAQEIVQPSKITQDYLNAHNLDCIRSLELYVREVFGTNYVRFFKRKQKELQDILSEQYVRC